MMSGDCKAGVARIKLNGLRGHLPGSCRVLIGIAAPGLANGKAVPLRSPGHWHRETRVFLDGALQLRPCLEERFPAQSIQRVHAPQSIVV